MVFQRAGMFIKYTTSFLIHWYTGTHKRFQYKQQCKFHHKNIQFVKLFVHYLLYLPTIQCLHCYTMHCNTKTNTLHSKEISLNKYQLVMCDIYQPLFACKLKERGILKPKSDRCISMCSLYQSMVQLCIQSTIQLEWSTAD